MDLRRRFTLIKLLQMIFGLITFGLYMHYNGQVALSVGSDSTNEHFVRTSFGAVAVVGFPFVIVLLTIIAYLVNNESTEGTLLNFLFSIVGFGMYLITGALVAKHWSDYGASDGLKVTTLFLFGTASVYLYEMVLGIRARCL